jgi:hypothetical protein
LPSEQSAFVPHVFAHALPVHLYVPQSPLPAVQLPEPLQAPTCVYVEAFEPSVHV